MSAFAGIMNFGPELRRVDDFELARLGAALETHGPDGGYDLVAANVGMSYRAFHTNCEARKEVQPLVAKEGHLLTWNGRLDNREDLIRQLSQYLPLAPYGAISDATIVFAAYLKWKKASFERLIGDFSLVLWDAEGRLLYLVRDVAGARALYYRIDSDRIVWSTGTTSLTDFLGGPPDVEEEYMAGAMSLNPTAGITPFKNIRAVKPAHVVTLTACGQMSGERFWKLDPEREIRYSTDGDYQERTLYEFTEAIRCRLRSDRPVFAELSGGLDSSSIVCLADKILSQRGAQTPGVETVSHVFDECPTSDERKFIRLVEAQRQLIGHHIKDEDCRLLSPLPSDITIVSPNPIVLSYGYHSGVRRAMDNAGARVLMSGLGGDQMFGGVYGAYPEVADLLTSFNLIGLHHGLRSWSKALKRSYVQLLWRDAIVRLFPQSLQRRISGRPVQLPLWYNHEFSKRMKLQSRMVATDRLRSFRKPSARDQARGFLSTVKSISSCWREEQVGIDVTYPYAHRPLVEFLQALPLDQLLRPGENRVVMRRMLSGILPPEIAARRGKGNPREAIFRAIARESARLKTVFEDSQLCARGYIEKEPLLAALDRARHGYETHSAFLVQTISLEFWLRGLDARHSLTRSPAALPGKLGWVRAAESISHAV